VPSWERNRVRRQVFEEGSARVVLRFDVPPVVFRPVEVCTNMPVKMPIEKNWQSHASAKISGGNDRAHNLEASSLGARCSVKAAKHQVRLRRHIGPLASRECTDIRSNTVISRQKVNHPKREFSCGRCRDRCHRTIVRFSIGAIIGPRSVGTGSLFSPHVIVHGGHTGVRYVGLGLGPFVLDLLTAHPPAKTRIHATA